jgi:hypothetical protein
VNNPTIYDPVFFFLNGAAFMGALTCALFFLRFWRRSKDRLFGIFSASFALMAIERLVFVMSGVSAEDHLRIYFIRLLAFLMILIGIWDKNRARSEKPVYRAKAS